MPDALTFGQLALLTSVAALLAVQSHRLSERLRLPTPALFLLAAVAVPVDEPSARTVERVVTVALVVILFDGGLHIGAARARSAARSIALLGVLGTFATVAGAAVLVHAVLGTSWYLSTLVATAIAPTDPAVVFSVLGRREVEGSSGTVLEGESGANDPVGIALLAALLSAGSLSGSSLVHAAGEFALQLGVGAAVGLAGGRALLALMRTPLPAEGLYPVRALVGAGALFGAATVLHGSGFLAVFVAGIVLGDERAPYKREVERFQSALASLGEVVAFALLGLTVHVDAVRDVLAEGLVVALVLTVVVRPLLGLPLLWGSGLSTGERGFVLYAGLKGAVPLLLGSLLVPLEGGERLYALVVVVVGFSVVVQAALVPLVAARLGVRMRDVDLEPFSLGVRLPEEPQGAMRLTVAEGAPADGARLRDLHALREGSWVSVVLRAGSLVPVRGDLVLQAGDDVLVLVDPEGDESEVHAVFHRSHSTAPREAQ